MTDYNAATVRFGKPGKLYVAPLGTTEPTTCIAAWGVGWVPLGYTSEGSTWNYEVTTEDVEVAEELDVFARVTTGRDASVEMALAEITKKNMVIAMNGGIVVGDAMAWSFEPPDIGLETRLMLGWDAIPTVADNDLRMIFRQVYQSGAMNIENRKGATKSLINASFKLEKPASGAKILKVMGAAGLNPIP